MSVPMRAVFEELGFALDWTALTEQPPAYTFEFGNLTLKAAQVTGQYLPPEFLMTGVARTPRSLAMIASSAPLEVESFEQGVAFIAAAIGPHFTPVRPTAWLDQGRLWQDHLPERREMAAYRARPCCLVKRDWFRLPARRLRERAQDAPCDAVATLRLRRHDPDRPRRGPAASDARRRLGMDGTPRRAPPSPSGPTEAPDEPGCGRRCLERQPRAGPTARAPPRCAGGSIMISRQRRSPRPRDADL